MRCVPRSLYARLVLVLMASLLIAQLISLTLHTRDRIELMSRAGGMQSAQRIADIVRLLDSVAPAERGRLVAVLSAAPLIVKLAPLTSRRDASGGDQSMRATLFSSMLKRDLGSDRQIDVRLSNLPEGRAEAMLNREREHGPPWARQGLGMFSDGGHLFSSPGFSFTVEVHLADGTPVSFMSEQPADMDGWPYRLLASLALLLVVVMAVSLFAVRSVTRPLALLADAAEQLGKDINRPPLAEQGPAEVVRAARSFNLMQARLARFINDRTRVLAAMSHDLKTPITRLRLRAELLDDVDLKQRFSADLAELENMVGATLDFMRGIDSAEALQPVDIMALLAALQADVRETGGQVDVEGDVAGPYPARPQALKRCLSNLLENAVKYGERASVSVRDDAGALHISIRDAGPGLPAEELEKVFQPFYRLEQSRNRETGGTGLGLTIARGIAESHGGSLVLVNVQGGGLEARLSLPRAATVE